MRADLFLDARRLFGGHVRGRAHDVAGLGDTGVGAAAPGQAEVHDDRLIFLGQHDVARLQVAMHDLLAVRFVQGQGDFAEQQGDGPRGHADLVAQHFRERPAVDERHGHVTGAVDLADVVHRTDVRVLERGRGPGLAQEPLAQERAVVEVELRHFQGDRPVQLRIVGEVDGPHTALAEQLGEAVAAEVAW